MRYIVRIVFFLPSLLTPVRASHASSHALLAADSPERYQEYVVDEHGKTSPSMMRREAFERKAPRRLPRTRLKSLLQKRQERMLRRREKLWDLEKELESVHTKSKSYKPKCVVLHGKKLKATPGTGHGFGAPHNANIEKCTEACVARVNLAKDGGTRSSGARSMKLMPKNALDGDGSTEFVSKQQQNEPWWQVDLGTDRKVGEVWISATNCVGCEVGLRDEPCINPTQTQTNPTQTQTNKTSNKTNNNGNSNDDSGDNENSDDDNGNNGNGDNDNGNDDNGNDDNGNNGNGNNDEDEHDEDETGELAERTSVDQMDLENNGEMVLLEKLANQIKGHESNEACNLGKTCGTLDENSNFVNCDGNTGQFLVIRHKGNKRLIIAEVEVWEDAILSRSDAVAKMMPEAEDADQKASMVLDGRADTTAISQAGDNPWLQIKLADDAAANSVGKISIYPGTDRTKFLPTKEKPMMVGVSTKECTEEGCAKAGVCGKLTTAKLAGPYIVDCGGKNGNFVWIEFPGKGRSINIATVEVEKSAQCEQVVLQKKDGKLTCISYKKYSGELEEPEEGVDYTSAICHPAGKVGPAGVTGGKGDKGKQGSAGPKGAAGAKGDEGEEGAVGEQGDVGAEGPEGLEADVAGLATMGQLNLAGVLCVAVTVAVMVILMQKVSPQSGRGGAAPEKTEGVEGEEGLEETFEEGGEAPPEEAEAEEGEQVA